MQIVQYVGQVLKRQTSVSALMILVLIGLALLHPQAAHAATSGTGSLPWDTPLTTLKNDISGPVALGISLLGIVICGATLIWAGEIGDFVRRIVMLVLVIAVLVGANSMLTTLFSSGAMITASMAPVLHIALS
jgi:type IV secretory pathway VirB2 component (pilin)